MNREEILSLEQHQIYSVNDIKRRLMSRCPETQLSAVAVLEEVLRRESPGIRIPQREFLLQQDVVGFLCDAMATNCWPLLERTAVVLELLSDSDRMLQDGHAVLVTESAQRRAHFLGKAMSVNLSTSAERALRATLRLIATLLTRWWEVLPGRQMAMSSLCPVDSLVSTLRTVLDPAEMTSSLDATLLTCAQTLSSLLCALAEAGRPSDVPSALPTCVLTCIDKLTALLRAAKDKEEDQSESEEEEDAQLMWIDGAETLCNIAKFVTRLRARLEDSAPSPDQEGLDSGLQASLEDAARASLDKVLDWCVPPVLCALRTAPGVHSVEDCPPVLEPLLEALQVSLVDGRDALHLAHCLATREFLHLLPALHRHSELSPAVVQLLSGILALLAVDLLDADSWWGDDVAGLAAHLCSGAPHLPADPADWYQLLSCRPYASLRRADLEMSVDEDDDGAAQQLVLLLMFFRCIVGAREWHPDEFSWLTQSVSAYVMSLPLSPGPDLPPAVLKACWLCIAVCSLQSAEPDPILHRASHRLTQLLTQLSRLEDAYTHNSTLLYWVFQESAVPPRLQQLVVTLWLSKEDNAVILKEILTIQREAIFPVLDVVSEGSPKVAEAGAQALRGLPSVDLGDAIWRRLPSALLRCSQDHADCEDAVVGAGLLLCLSDAETSSICPPADTALRIAHHLAIALGRNRFQKWPEFLGAALRVAERLILFAQQRADPRELTTFLSDHRLKEALPRAVQHEASEVVSSALRLLIRLLDNQARTKTLVTSASVKLDAMVLCSTFKSKDVAVIEAALDLLALLLETHADSPVVDVELPDSAVRALFQRLQQLPCKSHCQPAHSKTWRVLRALLARSPALSDQPWTHMLLKVALTDPVEQVDDECLRFIVAWLRANTKGVDMKRAGQLMGKFMLTETAELIAQTLLEASAEFQRGTLAREMAQSLLVVNAGISSETLSELRRLAQAH